MKNRSTYISALILFMGLLTSAWASEPGRSDAQSETSRLIEEGTDFLRGGRYDKAVDSFKAAVDLSPDDSRGHLLLGTSLLSIWRFDAAAEALSKAADLDPANPAPLVWLARCDIHSLEYKRAFERIRRSLAMEPSNADALAVLSLLLIHMDDLDRALEAAEKALSMNPGHGFAKVCLAHVSMLRKDPHRSAVLFAECLRENRLNAAAYIGLGQALSNMDRAGDALRVLNAGAKKNSFLPPMFATRGFVLFKLKATEQA